MAARRNYVIDVIRVFCRTILHSESDVIVISLELPAKAQQERLHLMEFSRDTCNSVSTVTFFFA